MKLPKDQPFWTSVVLHLAVLAALFLATIIETFKPKEKPHVFEMVDPAAQRQTAAMPAESPPVPEMSLPELPPVPDIAELPKPVERPPVPKPAKPAPAPAKPKPKIMTQEEFIRQFGAPKPREQTRTPSPRPAIEAPRIQVPKVVVRPNASPSSASQRPLTQQQMSALGSYSAQLRSRIDAAWAKPARLAGIKLAATVIFDVAASGRITNARLRSSSGNSAFDRSVLAAFRKAASAGPTPTGQAHSFTMTFRMTD